MNLYFCPDIESKEVELSEEESRHCTQVLRLGIGTALTLTDGKGFFYKGTINSVSKRKVLVQVEEKIKQNNDRNYHLHIAIAPTKNIDRFEWFLEKATEIGIDEITPILTEHSERRKIRIDRLERVIISAMKQSLKAKKPKLNPLISLSDFLESKSQNPLVYMAHCEEGKKELLKKVCLPGKDVLILIGPEGDFSKEEINLALVKGAQAVSFGESRLRTETAGLVATHSIYLINQ